MLEHTRISARVLRKILRHPGIPLTVRAALAHADDPTAHYADVATLCDAAPHQVAMARGKAASNGLLAKVPTGTGNLHSWHFQGPTSDPTQPTHKPLPSVFELSVAFEAATGPNPNPPEDDWTAGWQDRDDFISSRDYFAMEGWKMPLHIRAAWDGENEATEAEADAFGFGAITLIEAEGGTASEQAVAYWAARAWWARTNRDRVAPQQREFAAKARENLAYWLLLHIYRPQQMGGPILTNHLRPVADKAAGTTEWTELSGEHPTLYRAEGAIWHMAEDVLSWVRRSQTEIRTYAAARLRD